MSNISEIAFKPQRVFLIRHGQSTANVGSIVGGPESPLTDQGREEARMAGEELKRHNLNNPVVVVSPFTRTRQTSHHVLQALGRRTPEYVDPAVQERDFGPNLTGKDATKLKDEPNYFIPHPDSTRRRQMRILNPDWRPEAGESLSDVRDRAAPALDSLIKKHPNRDVVVVSHGHTIRALTAHFDGNWHSGRHVKNGEVKVFHVNHWGESFTVGSLDDRQIAEGKTKVHKDLRQLLKKPEHSHWEVNVTGSGHLKLTSPLSNKYVITASTPKSGATKKIEKDLRKAVKETSASQQADALIKKALRK